MLAILAPSFNQVSETFIADHARKLAPGRTVLVCQDSRGAEAYGLPVLSHLQSEPAGKLAARLRRRFGPPLAAGDARRLAAFLEAQGASVMLAEYGPMGVLAADVCAALGLPLHVMFHGIDASALLREPRTRRRYRQMYRTAASVIAVSRALADGLVAEGCPERLIRVVPCGIDPEAFPPGAPEPGRVLALGRLVEKKAPHLTIRAFALAAKDHPQARLDLVGDGPLRAAAEAAVAGTGMADRVTLHGALPHDACRALMRRAAVFAQHSVTAANGDTEGAPVAVAEAMATGLPVVATRHSGIPEQVVDGETGLLVAEGDVAGMGAAIARLLADPALAARMGEAGRARALERLDQARLYGQLRGILGIGA